MPTATIGNAADRAARFVSWNKPENWPMELDRLIAANEVGEWLCNAEVWNWLRRPSTLLSLVASQQYITLPADFGRFVSIDTVSGSVYRVKMETQEAVDRARRLPAANGTLFKGCILHTAPTALAVPVAQLEIGPIPGASAANVIRLSYIATWRTCTTENDLIPMPLWLHALYIRAFALYLAGWERDKGGTVEQRCASLRMSDIWQSAVDRDDTIQCDLGPMHGSAEEMIRGRNDEMFFSDQTNPVIGT